jgi:hypothetical protein
MAAAEALSTQNDIPESESMSENDIMSKAISQAMGSMLHATCIVYKRPTLQQEIAAFLAEIFEEDFLEGHMGLSIDMPDDEHPDLDEFMRQVVIWTKETSEEILEDVLKLEKEAEREANGAADD